MGDIAEVNYFPLANRRIYESNNEKKPFVLALPYLGSIYLQTRTKLKKWLKNILNCCKLQIVFKK